VSTLKLSPVKVRVTVEEDIQDVWVKRGEYACVWLGSFGDTNGRTQVELATLPDGTRRICLPAGAPVKVTTFEEAYGSPVPSTAQSGEGAK
jgi:hypothetical protein